ncbi:hypothetical protein WN944_022395 [Citrus x changshan-huyou]|uniref:NB-ARC domain-containing protein n=1 Tax=Citrus x changshan-huyou TaxID=2935761 RepID=A0AAP0N0S4_9ROSI
MGNVLGIQISCDALFSGCMNCARRNAAYVSQLEENLASLQTQLQKLIEAKNDVVVRVANAEQQQMRRLNKVQGWISRVGSVEAEVGELIRKSSEEIDKLCLGGYCSKNCQSSHKFGKKVSKMLQVVDILMGEGAFDVVAEKVPQPAVDERPLEPTIVGLESTLDKVWRCLEEVQVGIIGLYGRGGVGKTTLLTQINNKFIDTPNDFDVVIWVVVSKDIQLERIQEKIGERIGSFGNKSLEEKASDIFKILSKKKFLLLLDDVWERIDLVKVGVPFPTSENASKVVFTTRFVDVCSLMGAQKKFKIECLRDKEAWELFLEKVGEEPLVSHPDIPMLAQAMAKECAGLPLALITIGRAMGSKNTPEEWRYAIEMLRRSASEFPGMGKEVYPLLKFSYDSLSSDVLRSCLLYCSLFPEDYQISKIELIECWIGEGFLNGFEGMGVYNQGYYVIGVLVQACLLEEVGTNFVKMHDVIRDMSLWIACKVEKEKENFLVSTGVQLSIAPEVRKWRDRRRISLLRNKIVALSETPTCPHLVTLFLAINKLDTITNLKHLDKLDFAYCSNLEEFNYVEVRTAREPYGFDSLQRVTIDCCKKLKEVTWLAFAPNLKFVHIERCYEMDEIISVWKLGEVPGLNPFAKLQCLRLQDLSNLEKIYWNALSFPDLLELFVSECPKLKKLPLDINSARERKIAIRGEQRWWNELKWEDQDTLRTFLPCFESI